MPSAMDYLRAAGFKGEGLRNAWAVMMRESGGRPDAFNGNAGTGDRSFGLFQINMLGSLGPARLRQFGLSDERQLLDPAVNARVAYQMSKGGTDWGAWAIGPNAYKGAPSDAYAKYKAWYDKFPAAGGGKGTPVQAAASQAFASGPAGASAAINAGTAQTVRQQQALSLLAQAGQAVGGQGQPNFLMQATSAAIQQRAMTGVAAPSEATPVPGGMVKGQLLLPNHWKGTHNTDNLTAAGRNTAVDIMAKPGTPVAAPFAGVVVKHGSAQGGESVWLQSRNGQKFWLGHIANAVPVGTAFSAGQPIAVISPDHPRPHAHWDRLG